MKRFFLLTVVVLFTMPSVSNAQAKWFFSGKLNANIVAVDGEAASSAGLGVGIHRMLGEKFSLGAGFHYAGSDGSNALEADLIFAYYGKLADRFYYVPEALIGASYFIEEEAVGIGETISPFGLEFRPTKRLGFRANIVNLTYVTLQGSNIYNFSINPTLSVLIRF
jgi:hypothetical protein